MIAGFFASFGTCSVVKSFAPSRIGTIASVRSYFGSCARRLAPVRSRRVASASVRASGCMCGLKVVGTRRVPSLD